MALRSYEAEARDSIIQGAKSVLSFSVGASRDEIAARESAVQVLQIFGQNSQSSKEEKNLAYISFLENAKQLNDPKINEIISRSVGIIMYGRHDLAPQINKYMKEHVNIMQSAWNIQPDAGQEFRYRR